MKNTDYTIEKSFWTRLKGFVENVQVGCAIDEEEKDMILRQTNIKIRNLK